MKLLLRAAARLYPRAWRNRYGAEFDALIDELTPRWRDLFNVVVGALTMQISRLALFPVATAIAGAIAGVAVSLAMPPVYASSSWVLVQAPGTAADAGGRGQRIRTAIEAALQQTAFDKNAITVTLRGEPGQDPVLLELSASAASAPAAQQAAGKATGSLIDANLVTSERLAPNPDSYSFEWCSHRTCRRRPSGRRRATLRSAAGSAWPSELWSRLSIGGATPRPGTEHVLLDVPAGPSRPVRKDRPYMVSKRRCV